MTPMTNFLQFIGKKSLAMLSITNSFFLNQACLRLLTQCREEKTLLCFTWWKTVQCTPSKKKEAKKYLSTPLFKSADREVSAGISASRSAPPKQRWLAGISCVLFHHLLLKEQVEWGNAHVAEEEEEKKIAPSAHTKSKYKGTAAVSGALC